jgi:dTDP-4-amino-4,6-dideoxygalactose transaminase
MGEMSQGTAVANARSAPDGHDRQAETPPQRIPFVDLKRQAVDLHDDFAAAIWSVIDRAAYTMGPELKKFEDDFAAFCGASHCVGVSSGTDAVKLALLGAGVRPGDEVIVPVNTFIATAEAVSHIGAVPVFVDCLADTALIDPALIEPAITPRTTAILPVHLYGQPADMQAILDIAAAHDLSVVEDACQAHGARYCDKPAGSFGITAAFSFYPGKNLGALGDGGAVTTSDAEIAARLRLLRNHGQEDKYTHRVVGYCDRLHNLQAALLSVKLEHLAAWNAARREAAASYKERLAAAAVPVTWLSCCADVEPVYHLFVVELEERDEVRARLADKGVESGIHYPIPLHLQPAYEHLGYRLGQFPVAERLAGRILSLPMFPQLEAGQIEYVVSALDKSTPH